ncbi:MAG: 3-hydroxyacyl-CoA dehydrogenase NAD-binding domain-containing protein [Vampirovibrionales bacterium]|nr:3-hydroxyacyl-CoA dehydrogenase NAD-binding domain-containing protein [Vampirovibrionales bacterium]
MTQSQVINNTFINHISVLGAGTMGAGIAQSCLSAGFSVCMFDVSQAVLEKAKATIEKGLSKSLEKNKISDAQYSKALTQLTLSNELASAVQSADLIIEAVPEDLALKQQLFESVYQATSNLSSQNSHVIYSSNTSSISITAIGQKCPFPERFAGLHFFNPVALMPLVEIIQSKQTSSETLNTLTQFVSLLGKKPVLAKDSPGFIVNRVARPFYGEALKILGEYGETPETLDAIDLIMKTCGHFKMGPFELMDLIGIDVNFSVTQSVYNAYFQEPRYQPHPIQQAKVNAGHLGRKSGKGFYDYAR